MSDPLPGRQDVILADTGRPFKTETAAKNRANELKVDADQFAVIQSEGGWVIANRTSAEYARSVIDRTAKTKPKGERFFLGVFAAKSQASDTDHVELCVNCEILIAQRGVKTIIPERYVRHLATCRYPQEVQLPNQPRKTIAWVDTYTFTILKEVSHKDYLALKNSGTEASRKAFEVDSAAMGFDKTADGIDAVLDGVSRSAEPAMV